ncbi:hypothetical protein ACIRBX_08895 [Kitasatospora sp. NPDC096147]|uniref:hypothetical protein n=1 Tax=Kitasatospora sp. NPDC096147 TaxID=3364093 RepID=UPI00380A069C
MTDGRQVAEGFWDGDFTLGAAAPPGEPEEGGTALDALGPAGLRLGGRDLAAVLADGYRRMTGTEPGVR